MSDPIPRAGVAPAPLFDLRQRERLQRADLTALAANVCGAVRVDAVVAPDTCATIAAALDPVALEPYDPARYRLAAARLGPVINEFHEDGRLADGYWAHAEQALDFWQRLPGGPQLRAGWLDLLTQAWAGPVSCARTGGRELFWGMVREVNSGTLIHWDEVIREFPLEFLDRPPIAQLAANLFLSMPDTGGETTVWRRRWRPADEVHRTGFGYTAGLGLGDEPSVTVRAEVGSLVLFDPRNYHVVRPGGPGRRLALACFLGLTDDGTLILWS